MLKIKDGRLIASNCSFALPEGFNLIINPESGVHKMLKFESDHGVIKNGLITIEIVFQTSKQSAKEVLQDEIADSELTVKSEFLSVRRGNGTAIGLYYIGVPGFTEYYEELYDFKTNRDGQNEVSICVFIMAKIGKKLTKSINEIMELPNLKQFLNSIEYT